ncbi:MAG: type II secretion system F family protein, partial [Alphaproteobacteria bacterium]|nr:type II secretion system F family protein [Alphaproteobacteria bacterium]
MPLFHYKAVTQDGEALQGELEARSVDGVVEQLQRMGYLPIRIQEHNARQSSWLWQRARVSSKQVREMTGQLATLLRAGLPLDRAFELQIQLAGDPAMTELMQRIRDEVRGGSTLSAALEQHRGVFSRFYINMVRAGEMGGSLAEVLARIHEFMERAAELRSTVVSAMIYPAILASASLVSVFVLLLGVVPKFSQMFAQSGKSLPLITQFVIGLGNFLRHDGWMLLLAALLVVVVIKQQRSTAMGRLRWDARLLSWPLLGDLMLKFETARMARSLATLVANGVSLLPALGIIKEIMGNQLLA